MRASFDPPSVWMLLPPSIVGQLVREDGPNAVTLSPKLTGPIMSRLAKRSPHSEELWQTRREIIDHLESGSPGWGPWPSNSKDALAIGILLGFWIQHQTDQLVEELSEEELAPIEAVCREKGKSLEQYLIDRIVESKEEEDEY
jgi:hypothetical protein